MLKYSNLDKTMEAANHSKNSAMEAGNHVKHEASSKSHSRGFFVRKACFSLLAVSIIFGGCDKDDDKDKEPSKLARATVGNAEVIYQTQSSGGTKSTSSDGIFYKMDKNGKTEPILFINENGDTLSFPIWRIIDVNSDFLFFNGEFFSLDENNNFAQYAHLLVNKKSEKIFALPNSFIVANDLIRFSTDVKGNIYCIDGGFGAVYKINTVDYTIEEYLSSAAEVDKNGLCFYGNRIKHPSGKIVLWDDLIEGFNPGADNALTRGGDGLYYTFWGGYSYRQIHRIDDINNEVEATLFSEIELNSENDMIRNLWMIKVNHTNNNFMFFCGNNSLLLTHLFEFDFTSKTLRLFQQDYSGIQYHGYVSKSAFYFISGSNQNELVRLNLNTYDVNRITLTGFEIYQISSSITSDEISFSGLRYSDGKNIIGVVDANGNIISIVESNNNSKIENLIQLN